MYQILCVLIATIAYGTAAGHCQTLQAGTTTITFQSATYSDMRQLLAREATTGAVTVKASLGFPEQTRDRYPAVIVVHTLAGYRDANEGYVAAELRKAGFATLTYDSFAARGTTGTALQGSPGYLPIGVADAYAALRLLSRESRIDAEHIAIIGFSYGAEVAHLTAFEALRSALNPGPDRFAAHVAFYPGGTFGAVAEPGAYTGFPVLMLLGDKDDNLPMTKIESYLAPIMHGQSPISPPPASTRTWSARKNVRSSCSDRSDRPCSSTARRSPSTLPPLVPASPQRPAIQWDLTRRFAPNRSLIRFPSWNEACGRREQDRRLCRASPCPLRIINRPQDELDRAPLSSQRWTCDDCFVISEVDQNRKTANIILIRSPHRQSRALPAEWSGQWSRRF
jgi:dienelactone hydrolase